MGGALQTRFLSCVLCTHTQGHVWVVVGVCTHSVTLWKCLDWAVHLTWPLKHGDNIFPSTSDMYVCLCLCMWKHPCELRALPYVGRSMEGPEQIWLRRCEQTPLGGKEEKESSGILFLNCVWVIR